MIPEDKIDIALATLKGGDPVELKLKQGVALVQNLLGQEPPPCTYCGQPSLTDCENCQADLCADCADTQQYEDVDVCADNHKCETRCLQQEARDRR